jgi:DNA repair protein RadA/Sms
VTAARHPALANADEVLLLEQMEHDLNSHPSRLRSMASVTPQRVKWLVPGMIPLRSLTLVAGVGGLGKSTYLLGVAAAASLGDLLGDPASTIFVSFEDPAAEVLRPRLEAAQADLQCIYEIRFEAEAIDMLQLPRDLLMLRELVQEVRAKLIVIDPIVAAIESSLDAHKDQAVRHVLAGLAQLSEDEDCAVALVGHLNKAPEKDAYLRVANSAAFWNASRSVVLVTEDPERGEDYRLVAQRKANWGRLIPVERHRLEGIVLDALDPENGQPIETSRMTFVETADDVDRNEVLAKHSAAEKTIRAEDVLSAILADGEWHDGATIKQLTESVGIKERTLQLAAKELGVEYERRGFPASTWWRLPVAQGMPTESCATVDPVQPSGSRQASAPVAQSNGDEGLSCATEAKSLLSEAEISELGAASLEEIRRRHERGEL